MNCRFPHLRSVRMIEISEAFNSSKPPRNNVNTNGGGDSMAPLPPTPRRVSTYENSKNNNIEVDHLGQNEDDESLTSQRYYGAKYLFQTPYGGMKLMEIAFAVAIIAVSVLSVGDGFSVFVASFQLLTGLFVFTYNLFRFPCRWSPNMLLDFFLSTSSTLLLLTGGILVGALWPRGLEQLIVLLPLIFADVAVSTVDTVLTLRRYFRANDCALFYYTNDHHQQQVQKRRQQPCDMITIGQEIGRV